MLALISFILVIVGAINWFCIGLLQFDFVAGLFGSQSSIFSRIVYIAVGLGALMLLYNLIENKGQIKFNFKNKLKELTGNKEQEKRKSTYYAYPKTATQESGEDQYLNHNQNENSYSANNEEQSKNTINSDNDLNEHNNYKNE